MSQMNRSEITEQMNKVTPFQTGTTKKKKLIVSDDIVQELQACDVMYTSLKSQLANMIETHSKDLKDNLTTAPLFIGLIKSAAADCKEFEKAKFVLTKQLSAEKGYQITEWTCDYESKCVTYEVVKYNASKDKIIVIPEDVLEPLWEAQLYHKVVSDVITWLTDMHANDKKDTITTSAVFKGVLAMKARLFEEYDKAKMEMYQTNVPANVKAKYSNWSLSYDGGILTLTE